MKVIFHERFHDVYTSDPAAAPGRIAAVVAALKGRVDFVEAEQSFSPEGFSPIAPSNAPT